MAPKRTRLHPRLRKPLKPGELMEIAALRAQGMPWDSVAKQQRMSVKRLRKWVNGCPVWDRLLRDAERSRKREVAAESTTFLRRQMLASNGDPKLAATAAAKLLTYCRLNGADASPTSLDPTTMTPEELEDFLLRVPHGILEHLFADEPEPVADPVAEGLPEARAAG